LKSDTQETETEEEAEAEAEAAEVDDALRLVDEETVDRALNTEDDDRVAELETLAEAEDDTDLAEDEVLEEDDDPDREIELD
jgi:hypothetical protein